jgi:hypothetical protein
LETKQRDVPFGDEIELLLAGATPGALQIQGLAVPQQLHLLLASLVVV